MDLQQMWEEFKNKLALTNPDAEEVTFGVKSKNAYFMLQSNDGFRMIIDRRTAFESVRLKAIITVEFFNVPLPRVQENGYEDPLSETFGQPIVLTEVKRGKTLEKVMKWCRRLLDKPSLQRHDMNLFFDDLKSFRSLGGEELLELRDVIEGLEIPILQKPIRELMRLIQKEDPTASEEVIKEAETIEKWAILIIDQAIIENLTSAGLF